MLAHDLANKLAAVVSHCDLLDLEVNPSSPAHQHSEKIRHLALQMGEMLYTRECERKPSFRADVDEGKTVLLA